MLFSLFYTFVYYLWLCTYICVHTWCASQNVQENNCAIIPHLLPLNGLRLPSLQGKHSDLLSRLI